MTNIPDFTDVEHSCVNSLLFERYAKLVPLQLADSELQLGNDAARLTLCPTLYWSESDAHFIVCKVAENRYHCQFFYSTSEQFGTGTKEYDDIRICVLTLLQVQSDHARQVASISTSVTAANSIEDDYRGPIVA